LNTISELSSDKEKLANTLETSRATLVMATKDRDDALLRVMELEEANTALTNKLNAVQAIFGEPKTTEPVAAAQPRSEEGRFQPKPEPEYKPEPDTQLEPKPEPIFNTGRGW